MKVLGISSGNGVLLYPFKDNLLGNIECRSIFHTPNDIQWSLNFKSIPLLKDLNSYHGETPDVIIGHPDCGHASMLRLSRAKSFGSPKLNKSLNMFISGVTKYNPRLFLLENLPGLLNTYPITQLSQLFPNYYLLPHVTSVSVFGNSQISRKRLILVGIHKRLKKKSSSYFKLPKLKFSKLSTVDKLEKKLVYPNETLCHIREDNNTIISIYGGKRMSLKKIRRVWVKELKGKKKWPVNNGKLKNAPGVYRNLPKDFPLTARKQNRQFNSKGYMMSPRELAVIQGIPNEFGIWYEGNRKQYCINKGRVTVTKTPPFEVGIWFNKCITKLEKYHVTNKQK